MSTQNEVRLLISSRLNSHDAHVGFDRAVADFPEELRGVVPLGFAHSCWQFVEHMRRVQADILDFCVNPDYVYPTSMEDYWPGVAPQTRPLTPSPPCHEAMRPRPTRGSCSLRLTTTPIISASSCLPGAYSAAGSMRRLGDSIADRWRPHRAGYQEHPAQRHGLGCGREAS